MIANAHRVSSPLPLPVEIPLAVLLPTDEIGGHEHMLFEWLQQACEFGLRPTIYGSSNRELADMVQRLRLPWQDAGYKIHEKGIGKGTRRHNFMRTYRIALRLPPGVPILLAPGTMQASLLHTGACLAARRRTICYVPMTHDSATQRASWPRLRDAVAGILAAGVSRWITITDEQRNRLESHWRIDAPVDVIPNRLRVLSTSPAPLKANTYSNAALKVLYAGRFDPNQKGLDWLVEKLQSDWDWKADYAFTFQGRGAFRDALETLARHTSPEHVQILPWAKTSDALSRTDVLLLPSRFEGFPLVAIEAIWAGVPVIATLESGLSDVLPAKSLFPFGDFSGFKRALDNMKSPAARDSAVVHARTNLAAKLGEKTYKSAVRAVIDGIAGR